MSIFKSNRAMLKYEHAQVARGGPFWGMCDALTGHEWNRRPLEDILPIGTIMLSLDKLTHSMIAHEVAVHAALHYGRYLGLRYARIDSCYRSHWRAAIGPVAVTEERLAMVAEALVKQTYQGLAENGIKEFEP